MDDVSEVQSYELDSSSDSNTVSLCLYLCVCTHVFVFVSVCVCVSVCVYMYPNLLELRQDHLTIPVYMVLQCSLYYSTMGHEAVFILG